MTDGIVREEDGVMTKRTSLCWSNEDKSEVHSHTLNPKPWQTHHLVSMHCCGMQKNLQTGECPHKPSHYHLLPPSKANKVAAVFPCQRWGTWLRVSKPSGYECGAGATSQAINASSAIKVHLHWRNFFSSSPTARPAPLNSQSICGYPSGAHSLTACLQISLSLHLVQ